MLGSSPPAGSDIANLLLVLAGQLAISSSLRR